MIYDLLITIQYKRMFLDNLKHTKEFCIVIKTFNSLISLRMLKF